MKIIAFVAMLALGLPVVASAQTVCMPRARLALSLKAQYDEEPRDRGLSVDGLFMFELFTSPAGTWTWVRTETNGRACVMNSGQQHFELPRSMPAEQEDPT